jgi:hypothetical protein
MLSSLGIYFEFLGKFLSYHKQISTLFSLLEGTLTKKKSKFFPHLDMVIYTPIESPCRL